MRTWLVGCLLPLFIATVSGQAKTNAALNTIASEFAVAFSAGDAAKVAAFYADDAFVMPPNGQMVRGRGEIEAYYRAGFAGSKGTLRLQPIESVIGEAHAFEVGTSSLGNGRSESAGKYIVVYRRVSGEWKIAYDIFNNDER